MKLIKGIEQKLIDVTENDSKESVKENDLRS